MTIVDNRFFDEYTGTFLVKFSDPNYNLEREVFGSNWTLLQFILMAYKEIFREDRRTFDTRDRKEAKNWKLIRLFFLESESNGIVEVRKIH